MFIARTAYTNVLKPQRGDMCALSESRIKRIKRKTPIKNRDTTEPLNA